MNAEASGPLNDAEIEALDAYLAQVPPEHEAMDVVMLDGFLVGTLLQPETIPMERWLPLITDAKGAAVEDHPGGAEAAARFVGWVMRRHAELSACIQAREPFDPLVFELLDEKSGQPLQGRAAIEALAPWSAGFAIALEAFPALDDLADPDLDTALLGVLRHAPPGEGAEPEYLKMLDAVRADVPLDSLEEALEDLLDNVLAIADIARPNLPLQRAEPKIGRNDPCPCGSGRKYKLCHGAN